MQDYHAKSINEVFEELKTSKEGLTQAEAKKRLKKYGKNILKKTHRFRPFKIFFSQFNSFLIYILIIAAAISFFINHFIDGIVISIVVILNAILGFFQQYRAEKAIKDLKKLIIPKSKVIRNGKMIEILSSRLVPGDIIILNPGDKISTDARIIESLNLQTDESSLTGESLPVSKISEKLDQNTILARQKNLIFTGTQVVRGEVKAVVVSTGMHTIFGKLAESLQEIEIQKTPMQKRLDKFSKQIGITILILVFGVMLLGFFEQFDAVEIFLTAVALAVSAIPEGLPAVLTISFAISSIMMSKNNVIIRRLPAVESLGSVTVICSDKTGTITEEKMQVKSIFANDKFYTKNEKSLAFKNKQVNLEKNNELLKLLKTSILCNDARFELLKDGHIFIGDPTEKALVSSSLDLGLNKKLMTELEPSIKKFEFTSSRKMMSVLRDTKKCKVLYSKGAPEKIIEVSNFELINGQIKKLTLKRKKELLDASKKMESSALRVLGFAYKNFPEKEKVKENALIFLGLMGMIDPPRKEVKNAIKQCQSAGISVKMITGDSALTAISVANKIGIKGKAITEEELEKINDEELLRSIDDIAIFARTTPKQKLRIANILQKKGEVIAMTGDGINDSLALKAADIGIAMGQRGTDVSRDVSDIVLIDDNFASIVEGVKEGRKTYDNIKKFTKYFLAVNFSTIFLVFFALIMGILYGSDKWFLPLLPLQILWMNLVTDSLPALSLVFEKEEDVMKTKPRGEKSLLEGIGKFIVTAGILTFLIELIVYLTGVAIDLPIEKTRTLILTTAILFVLFFAYACRSNKPMSQIGLFSNKWMNYAILVSILLHLILLYTPLAIIFNVVPLTIKDWIFILPFAVSGVLFFEVGKIIKARKKK